MISLVLVIIAIVCFFLAAFGLNTGRVNAVALGLALWSLSTVVRAAG